MKEECFSSRTGVLLYQAADCKKFEMSVASDEGGRVGGHPTHCTCLLHLVMLLEE